MLARIDDTGVPLLLARFAVGGWFAYLALLKLANPIEFLKQVRLYGVFPTDPPQLMNFLVLMLPYLELLCALALILGVLVRGAGTIFVGMLLFFGPLLINRAVRMYAEGHGGAAYPGFCWVKFDCGCGTGEVYICHKLAENSALLLGALLTIFSRSRFLCIEGFLVRKPRPLSALETAVSGA
jgi:uncharacterized membrane protein YphA (DoxX/SURF4 family)